MINTTEIENICGLKRSDFQATVGGKETDLYILKNNQGNEVAITNYGGALVAIMVPDKNGNRANVIQGHDNIQDVINSPEPYLQGTFRASWQGVSVAYQQRSELSAWRLEGLQRKGLGGSPDERTHSRTQVCKSLWRRGLLWRDESNS